MAEETAEEKQDSEQPQRKNLCRNCETELSGDFCHVCGQHSPRSRRLNTREILRDFFERIFSLESSFLKTLVGLTLRPGTVCSEYVAGKRKRYTNPFAYYLLAAAVDLFLTGMGSSATAEDAPTEFILKYFAQIGLLFFVPLAFLWSKLFRRAERNLAENYVFSLYMFGQVVWCEVLLLGPLSFVVPSETIIVSLYLLVAIGYFVFSGTVFYQEKPHIVFMKLLVSVLAFAIVRIALLPVWPDDV